MGPEKNCAGSWVRVVVAGVPVRLSPSFLFGAGEPVVAHSGANRGFGEVIA